MPRRFGGEVPSLAHADACLHNNLCPYARNVFETAISEGVIGFIAATACDSIKRLYDALRAEGGFKFMFLLDLPHRRNDEAVRYYALQLRKLSDAMGEMLGVKVDPDELRRSIGIYARRADLINSLYEMLKADAPPVKGSEVSEVVETSFVSDPLTFTEELESFILSLDGAPPGPSGGPRILITGSIVDTPLLARMVEEAGGIAVADDTCSGIRPHVLPELRDEDPYLRIAGRLLRRPPCSRMKGYEERVDYIRSLVGEFRADGVISHSLKFCDFYSYDYSVLRECLGGVPVLSIESDYTSGSMLHQRTRVDAFLEMLRKGWASKVGRTAHRSDGRYFVAGIDSGSLSTEAVILDPDGAIISWEIGLTGANAIESSRQVYLRALERAGLREDDVRYIVSTGYGRVSIPFASESVTEISCHAKGAFSLFPGTRTVIDIGGQDSKVIVLDGQGKVANFVMNDKCAAGTGKFLEVTAKALGLKLDDLGEISSKSESKARISSMCTVFAESEVVSLIAEGVKIEDIVAGLHDSIAKRVFSLLKRAGGRPPFVITGGVAKNPGVVGALSQLLGADISVPEEPQIVGALGAAILALERVRRRPFPTTSALTYGETEPQEGQR